jgi:hypothetical protein
MAKVIIYLRDHELTVLKDLAQREYRVPKAQAALIIRRELEKLGMITGEQSVQSNHISPLSKTHDSPVVEGG